jgi:exosortase
MTVVLERPRSSFVTWYAVAFAAAVLVLLALIYYRTAGALWRTWMTNENYSHGPLVPLVSVGLAWLARGRLAEARIAPDRRGLWLLALACGLQILGLRSDVFALETYSMVIMAFGLSLTFLGRQMTRALAFPLGYLGFMTIFPPWLVVNLSVALKELTVTIATRLAELGGVVLQRSGMTLYLAGGEVRIENPCSGLRSLVALLATGAVFAHLQPGSWRPRSALFVAAVPLAVIGNVLRITLVLLVGHYLGVELASGAFHDGSGYVVYALALVGLLGLRAALGRREPRAVT